MADPASFTAVIYTISILTNSLKCRFSKNMKSLRISNVHLSPKTSKDKLIGQSDLLLFFFIHKFMNNYLQNGSTFIYLHLYFASAFDFLK